MDSSYPISKEETFHCKSYSSCWKRVPAHQPSLPWVPHFLTPMRSLWFEEHPGSMLCPNSSLDLQPLKAPSFLSPWFGDKTLPNATFSGPSSHCHHSSVPQVSVKPTPSKSVNSLSLSHHSCLQVLLVARKTLRPLVAAAV